jgi:WD40 repeat protein
MLLRVVRRVFRPDRARPHGPFAARPPRPLRWAGVLAAAALSAGSAVAQPAAQGAGADLAAGRPFLVVETGMHTAPVTGIAVDAAGRTVATVSEDRAIRLWSPDGAPLGVLRVPVGPDDWGALNAVAVSPDARWLVAGGRTGEIYERGVQFAFYRFDLRTQTMRGRWSIPAAVLSIAVSGDGSRVAVGFAGGAGLHVYDLESGALVWAAGNLGRRVESLTYLADGRLAAAAEDGQVRIYDRTGRQLAARTPVQGARPQALAASPDGSLLAVTYHNGARVDVLSSSDLAARWQPDVRGVARGVFGAVAWTPMGGSVHLVAAGTVRDGEGRVVVRRWTDFGHGPPEDLVVGQDTVNAVAALPSGGFVFAAADPAWGRVAPDGRIAHLQTGLRGDFRDLRDGRFAASADGAVVEFGMTSGGRDPVRLDLNERTVAPAPDADPALQAPVVRSAQIRINAALNGQQLEVAGRRQQMDQGEVLRSLAVAPGDRFVAAATDRTLRVIDPRGAETARAPLPADGFGVTVLADARRLVVALGDGTLRWYRVDDGGRSLTELLAVFVHADAERWVAWTPQGFFDVSDRGQSLVGYLLNQERAASPRYFDFAQLYRQYYAPELIAQRLRGAGDEELGAAVASIGDLGALLTQQPPPSVLMTEVCFVPPGGERTCREVTAASASRGVARVNRAGAAEAAARPTGLPASATPGAPQGGPSANRIELPAGVDRVTIRYAVADRGGGVGPFDALVNGRVLARSNAVTRGARRTGAAAATADGRVPAPAPTPPRPSAQAGAAGPAAERLEETEIFLDPATSVLQVRAYDPSGTVFGVSQTVEVDRPPEELLPPRLFLLSVGVNAYTTPDIAPLRGAVPDARTVVARLREQAAGLYSEVVVAAELYDGAATRDAVLAAIDRIAEAARPQDTVVMYLAGHGVLDADGRYIFVPVDVRSVASLSEDGVTEARLLERWEKIRASNSILLLDTCHAGGLSLRFVGKMQNETGRFILAASSSVEEALDRLPGLENGLFGHAVLSGLSGEAARARDGVIDNFDLGLFVTGRVSDLARRHSRAQRAEFRSPDALRRFPMAQAPQAGADRPTTETKP